MSKQMIVTIEAGNFEELKDKIKALALELGLFGDTQTTGVVPMSPEPEKKAKGRPKKEAAQVMPAELKEEPASHADIEDAVDVPAETFTAPSAVEPASKEQAMEALTTLNGKKGLPAARVVLLKFGANKFSELKDADLGAFVVECQRAMAS